MKSIAIGSKNFAKVEAVRAIFKNDGIVSVSVPSDVSDQPFSDEETMKGALNRANNALREAKTTIGIGLEGGVLQMENGIYLCNWGALVDESGYCAVASGAKIKLPNEIGEELLKGRELGPIMDDFAKMKNVRKLEGAVGVLTNGIINRKEMFEHIVKLLRGQYEFNR
ncbi:DUF84 family protein [Bacillus suaedaesalsae]|uniref:Probable inosine/xanthosine triphosphatase n=1 Tax=Bacillus suaedaesalsae TaxID=2810349 RepID=A0ABS2DD83_9BACI|nr:DUF84 family protein [Bacillus suaedaesalsae]MBM6616398.1 DUF84 family protein [Bacillus suaedaesalsae]